MTLHAPLDPEETLALLGVADADRPGCLALLAGPASPAVECVLAYLASRLGSAEEPVPELVAAGIPVAEGDWLAGMLRFVPELLAWHRDRNITADVTRATLADFGRNLAINRRVHQRFGMDTYKWLTHPFAGRLFQLGRLQYLLHQPQADIPGVQAGEWIVGIHIPEDGGLGIASVRESLALAAAFFAAHFPDRPVRTANCESWLLDPYLRARMHPDSNIAQFVDLFSPYGQPRDEPTDAVYFTFRTRRMDALGKLPRNTTLQKLVLERIAAGGTWQLGFGALQLPQ